MKLFEERNPVVIGSIGIVGFLVVVITALQYQSLPFLNGDRKYSAYFAEAGGLLNGADVEVSGTRVGQVSDMQLDGARVLVTFTIDKDVALGDRSEAAIKTKSLLGAKMLAVQPRGSGRVDGPIPLERTTSPYQISDALGDLATTVDNLNTDQLSNSLATLSETFQDTPADLKLAVEGIGRFSQSLGERDAQLRDLLANANKATAVLADRTGQVTDLIVNSNALLAELQAESSALDNLAGHISFLAQQVSGFVEDNRAQLRPALDKLNGVLTIIDDRKDKVRQSLKLLNKYTMSFGEALSSGPFFKAYVANLLPGQFLQPFIDAAFSDLGIDPNVLAPSQRNDPQIGQPATPALPVPYPRTGQAGEPRLTLPEAITGNFGDSGCGPPGVPLPGPTGCYPYREPPPAPPAGGPPPGPPALAPGQTALPTPPSQTPVFVPAPGEPLFSEATP